MLTETEKALLWFKDRPFEYVRDVIKPSKGIMIEQELVLKALPYCMKNEIDIAIRSGHGTGKSSVLSWIIIWAIRHFPFIKIPCTAGKESQLKDILWAEIAQWHRALPPSIRDEFVWTATEYRNSQYPEDWFAVARTATDPNNMQGFHAPYLIFIIDEAPAVANEIFNVIRGTQTTQKAIIIMTGNPTLLEGEFYDAFHKYRNEYKLFHFNSENSKLVNPNYCKKMEAKFGKDSDEYRIRVLGDFPLAGESSFIPLVEVEKAVKRTNNQYTQFNKIFVGVDPARFGDDETVMCIRRGMKQIHQEVWSKKSIPETIGRVYGFVLKHFKGFQVVIAVDDTGLGSGVTDGLRYNIERDNISWISIIAEHNNGTAIMRDEEGRVLYGNRGTELWAAIRMNIGKLDLIDDPELISQLSVRNYSIDAKGCSVLERKEMMKKRGLKSPDRADALALTFSESIIKEAELIWI